VNERVTLLGALSTTKSTAAALLKSAGLRTTRPRLRVLEKLAESTTPVSHGELVEELEHSGMDRTTVYRNLLDLTDAGLVRRSDLGDHVWRFELTRGADKPLEHPHFTCTDCGTVECLPEVTVQVARGRRAPRSIAERKVQVQLRGLCDDCS
jgi:Fur family ferric uptake transcriptional regulator